MHKCIPEKHTTEYCLNPFEHSVVNNIQFRLHNNTLENFSTKFSLRCALLPVLVLRLAQLIPELVVALREEALHVLLLLALVQLRHGLEAGGDALRLTGGARPHLRPRLALTIVDHEEDVDVAQRSQLARLLHQALAALLQGRAAGRVVGDPLQGHLLASRSSRGTSVVLRARSGGGPRAAEFDAPGCRPGNGRRPGSGRRDGRPCFAWVSSRRARATPGPGPVSWRAPSVVPLLGGGVAAGAPAAPGGEASGREAGVPGRSADGSADRALLARVFTL